MRISFCIPAHDEEAVIGPTVGALSHAAHELALDHEIIVACDACTDRTAEVAIGSGARVICVEHRQISKTRNSAAAASSGGPHDVLIFVDADTIVPVGAVQQAIEAIRAGAVGGGAGVVFDGWVPLWGRLMLPPLLWMFRVFRLTGGAYFFCTRDALNAVGGWNESVFAGEEIDLARAMHRHSGRRRFVIIRERVVTSGRKMRTHGGREIFGFLLRAVGRPSFRTKREKLDIWYGPRREDPGGQPRNV